jgi:flagellar hook-basal body complex protein FliE
MVARIGNLAQAYADALKRATGPGMEPPKGGGDSFADMVKDTMTSAADTLKESEKAAGAAAAGKANLADVVTAVTQADLTLHTVLAVRDRLVQAYQDILRMPM